MDGLTERQLWLTLPATNEAPVLLDPLSDLVTLAYCSTQRSEADLGAPHALIDRHGPTFAVTGLREATFVYPSRLVTEDVLRLGRPIGRVLDEMPSVRREL